MTRLTVEDIRAKKVKGEKIVMLTAYDYPSAGIAEAAGVDTILVGDTLGMVVLGYDSTIPVTMDDMVHHAKAVVRGSQRALVVVDMPFMSYQASPEDAMRNAGRILQETGAQAVKLEGGVHMADTVRRIVQIGIPVVGHIGLTPQSVNQIGGYRLQGRTVAAGEQILADAAAIEQAGAFAIVLEEMPRALAKLVTELVSVPTIGIGAGAECDGQVQVWHDLLALYTRFVPRHVRQFAQLGDAARAAIEAYAVEVRAGTFPSTKESFGIEESVLAELTASTPVASRSPA